MRATSRAALHVAGFVFESYGSQLMPSLLPSMMISDAWQ
jgi:hypothetical protein